MRSLQYLLAASCLALAACSEPVSGPVQTAVVTSGNRASVAVQNEVYRDVPAGFFNPCNGEQIIGTTRIHILVTSTDTRSGNSIFNYSTTMDFNGIGETTGTSYTGRTREAFKYSFGNDRATEFTVESEMRVISQGSPQNFTTTSRVHITMNATGIPTAEQEFVKAECRG